MFFFQLTEIMKRMRNAMYAKDDAYTGAIRVYGRIEDPYGNPVARRTTRTGRTTFWVPVLQR